MSKNPDMDKSTAFAIATQQSHKLNKSPKGYGTSEGKKKAKNKYRASKKSYTQTADPRGEGREFEAKQKEAGDVSDTAIDQTSLLAFSDELEKLGFSLGSAAKGFGRAFKGENLRNVPSGRLLKQLSKEAPKQGRKLPLREALKRPELRGEAAKTIGARGAVGAAGGMAAKDTVERHKKRQKQRMGRAYVTGARDMYGRMYAARRRAAARKRRSQQK